MSLLLRYLWILERHLIDFNILLHRLECLDVRDLYLNWFESFLTRRSVGNVLNDVISGHYFIIIGVPQGSVLGPLLYLIYVDTMRFYLLGRISSYQLCFVRK